jgi:hypothetical protein
LVKSLTLGSLAALTGLCACLHTTTTEQKAEPSSQPYPIPTIYRIADVGKPGQPHLQPKQKAWIGRILRTPYYKLRVANLRYVLSPAGPPLAVFDQFGNLIVDHVASNEPCNPFFHDPCVSVFEIEQNDLGREQAGVSHTIGRRSLRYLRGWQFHHTKSKRRRNSHTVLTPGSYNGLEAVKRDAAVAYRCVICAVLFFFVPIASNF